MIWEMECLVQASQCTTYVRDSLKIQFSNEKSENQLNIPFSNFILYPEY